MKITTKLFLGFLLTVLIAPTLMQTVGASSGQSSQSAESPQMAAQRADPGQELKQDPSKITGYVLQEVDGKVVCRDAAPNELDIVKPHNQASLHIISPIHTSGVGAQDTGLKITLRGTAQLENFPQAKAAFLRAAQTWEGLIQSPITLVIDVDFGTTRFGTAYPSPNILGSTSSQEITGLSMYTQVRSQLIAKASDSRESSLYNALPVGTVPTDLGATAGVRAPSSVFRALGLLNAAADPAGEMANLGPPPAIGFNSAFNFDFDPSNGIDSDKTDFDAVAVHEIGHALGFTSNVGLRELDQSRPITLSLLDILRFRPGIGLGTFATSQRVLSSGGSQVFYAGSSQLGLSTGRPDGTGGDGNQASHWQDDAFTGIYIGIMDPNIGRGQRKTISSNDLLAFNSLGYQIRSDPPSDGLVEVATDDGTTEGGFVADGTIVVNRLTPPAYPATLKTIRIRFDQFNGLPFPIGQSIRLVAFAGSSGTTRPTTSPTLLVDQSAPIPQVGTFVDFDVSNTTITSGDLYVGFQTQTPSGGVRFSFDSNGPQQARGFFSTTNGRTFAGPIVIAGSLQPTNLLIRGVFQIGSGGGGGGTHPPAITNLAGHLDGDVVTLAGTATDADGDIAQAQVKLLDALGRVTGQTEPFAINAGTSATINFTLAITGLKNFPTTTQASLTLIDSSGQTSDARIVDFSQADPGGPTVSNASISGIKMKIKGKNLLGQVDVEINGVIVASGFNQLSNKLVVKGSLSALNLHSGSNRLRIRKDNLWSNIFVLQL